MGNRYEKSRTFLEGMNLGELARKHRVTIEDFAHDDTIGLVPVTQADGTFALQTAGGNALEYQGTWNADTNTPNLSSGVGTQNHFYIVSDGGTTSLDGISRWDTGDWVVFNGSAWTKIDNSDQFVSVVFAPNKPTLREGEFATWPEVMAAFAKTFGPAQIYVDFTGVPLGGSGLPEITIPAGAWDFEGRGTITTKFAPNLSGLLVPVAGTTFENIVSISNGIGIYNTTAVPIISIGGGGVDEVFGIERNAAIASAVGAAPVVEVDTGGVISAGFGGAIKGSASGFDPAVRIVPNAFAIMPLFNVPQLEAGAIEGDATTTIVFIVSSSFTIDLTQPALLGTVIVNYAVLSSQIAFDPSVAGSQLSATILQNAIDELTNKHVNGRSTTYNAAGTFSVAANDPKLILVDASGIGVGVINIDLPDPSVDSGPWKVKRTDSNGSATVNIRGTAGAQVDGAVSQTLGVSPAAANLETDGTNWYRV